MCSATHSIDKISAVVAHESLPNGRATGSISVRSAAIYVEAPGYTEELDYSGLGVRWGGANDSLLFITHSNKPGLTVFTRDKALILRLNDAARQRKNPLLDAIILDLSRARRKRHVITATVLGVVAAGLCGLYALRGPMTSLVAALIPKSWERTIGEAVYTGLRAQTKIIDDAELEKELDELLEPVLTAAAQSGYSFDVHIANDPSLNAFALPGGVIVINSGSLLKAESTEEVLGVFAHEVSHVTHRHMTKQVVSVFGLYLVVDFMLGDFFGTAAAISQGATYLLQQGFSRESESEADSAGLGLLLAAGINPSGMVTFFERLESESAESLLTSTIDRSFSFLSTHPATKSRIEELRRRIQAEAGRTYVVFDKSKLTAFQTKLREKM